MSPVDDLKIVKRTHNKRANIRNRLIMIEESTKTEQT